MESLIKAGAMDQFGKRAALLSLYTDVVERISKEQKVHDKNQFSLFGDEKPVRSKIEMKIADSIDEFTDQEKLSFEKELLGFFLTDHPLNQALERLSTRTSHTLAALTDEKLGSRIKVGGLIATVKKILTRKSNAEMAFVTLEDNVGYTIECVIFPKVFDEYKFQLNRDAIVIVEGKLDFKDERPVIIVDTISRLAN